MRERLTTIAITALCLFCSIAIVFAAYDRWKHPAHGTTSALLTTSAIVVGTGSQSERCKDVVGTCGDISNGPPAFGPVVGYPVRAIIEPDHIAELRKKAHAMGLHWVINCSYDETFYGLAYDRKNDAVGVYIEDGVKPWWAVEQGTSQQNVAEQLVKLLDGPPNVQPEHRPPPEKQRICPPALRGD